MLDYESAFDPDVQAIARGDAESALAGRLSQDLGTLFSGWGEEASNEVYKSLLAALAQGDHPSVAARNIEMDILTTIGGVSRNRAMTIARTEMLGAYRDTQLNNYRANSDVVEQWMWSAADGACPMCSDLDGDTFDLDESQSSHPGCRCACLPVTRSYDDILSGFGIDTSEMDLPDDTSILNSYVPMRERFAELSAAEQDAILGKAAGALYRNGDLSLDDLVGRTEDGQYYQKSLKELGYTRDDLQAALNQDAYNAMQAASDETAIAAATAAEQTATGEAAAALSPVETAQQTLADAQQALADAQQAQADAEARLDAVSGADADYYSAIREVQQAANAVTQAERDVAIAEAQLDAAQGGMGYVLNIEDQDALNEAMQNLFGRELTRDELGFLVGARPGDTLDITAADDVIDISLSGTSIDPARLESAYTADRSFYLDEDGTLIAHNAQFMVDPEYQGQGFGAEVFGSEAENLSRMGVDRIETSAAGDVSDKRYNGYYTWARFGYNAPIDWETLSADLEKAGLSRADLPDAIRTARTIQQLMRAPGGAAFWKQYGSAFDGIFNLKSTSVSMKVLRAYLREKGITIYGPA